MAICANHFVNPDELDRIPVAPGSETYSPVAHAVVRNHLIASLAGRGLMVKSERWALSQAPKKRVEDPNPDPSIYDGYGSRVFGYMEVGSDGASESDYRFAIGVRNSQDKTMALGLALGINVFICENMVLAGDIKTYRKHTSRFNIAEETERALSLVLGGMGQFSKFLEMLKQVPCPNVSFEGIVCDAIQAGIMPGTAARDMLMAWYKNEAPKDRADFADRLTDGVYGSLNNRSAWDAHGLWTDLVAKRQNLTSGSVAVDSQRKLNDIFKARIPSLVAVDSYSI